MNPLRYVGQDEPLTTEQGLYIKERAVMAARRAFIGRRLFGNSRQFIDSGSQTFGYDTLTEIANASFDYKWPGRESQDIINLARETVAIPLLHKEFEINKLDLASSRQSGAPLNTSTVESAVYKVSLLEDSMLILGYSADGGTTYEVKGLYNAAVNDENTDLPWLTYTNIPTSVNKAIALMLADNIMPPYNLTLHPTEYSYALTLIANTAVSYLEWIKQALQGGDVFCTPAIAAGDGLLTKANPEGMFQHVLAEDLTTETEVLDIQHGNNLFGRVYVRGLPIVYDTNACCKLSAIESP